MLSLSCCRTPALAFVLLVAPSAWSSEFATSVVQVNHGPNANPSFPATNILGGPRGGGFGAGSLDVVVLGTGGTITVGFNVLIKDGPGADFLAFENGFGAAGTTSVFSEVALVEVSSDGTNFARFPTRYGGPPMQQPPFGTLPMGTFSGMVGGVPVLSNVVTNAIPAEDPVRAGGEAFDLAELLVDPLVIGGLVDLDAIQFVRFLDVPEGQLFDSSGNLIWDNGGATSSVDLDAVAVVNHSNSVTPGQPICDLSIDASGVVVLRLGDPNGLADLNLAELRASFNLVEFPFATLLSAFTVTGFQGGVIELTSIAPLTGLGVIGPLAVSVSDASGSFSGDQVMIQG